MAPSSPVCDNPAGTRDVTTSREQAVQRVREAAERVAHSHGLEIFDLQFRRESIGWVLRIMVDRPWDPTSGPERPDDAVGIEDCQRVSHDLSALLDVEDDLGGALGQAYTLEVSSPGLDRPLRGEADYRRFVGRLAKVVTTAPVDGQTSFAGRLSGVEDGVAVLAEGRRTHRVPLASIKRARLDVEF
jgi:ribosome maturation factor RimP